MVQYYYIKIFFYGKNVFTAGSKHKPAVMGAHHQWLAHASPPVYEPAVMNPSITAGSGTGGDDPAITIDLNPTVPKTVGDALLEPAVIGVAVVVIVFLQLLTIARKCEPYKFGSRKHVVQRCVLYYCKSIDSSIQNRSF